MDEKLKEYLNESLNVLAYLNTKDANTFYDKIFNYFKQNVTLKTLENHVESFKKIYHDLGFNEKEILEALIHEPALLHTSKESLYYKYLMLSKLNFEHEEDFRRQIFYKHPKDLRISCEMMYAKIKFLLSQKRKVYDRKPNEITRKMLLKTTTSEFLQTYAINPSLDKEKLLAMYPFDAKAKEEIKNWDKEVGF